MNYSAMDNFGGATQFAGGGFMTSHTDVSPEEKRAMDVPQSETLRSLTVAQLSKAQQESENGECMCDGRPIKTVTVVGVLVSVSKGETAVTISVYDGTGVIEAKQYLEDDTSQELLDSLEEGKYVRVYGGFKGAVLDAPDKLGPISAYSIRRVTDHNEVVYHNLDVIFQHMYITQGQNVPPGNLAAGMSRPQAVAPTGNAMQPLHQGPGGNASCVQAVRQYLSQPCTDTGFEIAAIVRDLAAQFSEQEVRAVVLNLETEAHLYTTVSPEWVKLL